MCKMTEPREELRVAQMLVHSLNQSIKYLQKRKKDVKELKKSLTKAKSTVTRLKTKE